MGAIKATQDNSVAISNVYEQEQGDGDWVDNTPSIDYKLPEITVEADSTSTALKSFDVITENDNVRLYNGTDGLVEGSLGATTTTTGTVNTHDIFGDGSAVATYNLDGNANDLGGNYDPVYSDSRYTTGIFGECSMFSSTNMTNQTEYHRYNNQQLSNNFTLSCFVKSSELNDTEMSNYAGLITIMSSSFDSIHNGNKGMCLMVSNGNIAFGVQPTDGGDSASTYISTGYTKDFSQWVNCSLTYDGEYVRCYVNGELTITQSLTVDMSDCAYYGIYMSRYWSNNNRYMPTLTDVQIDQVRIFNRALTSDEVNTLYNEQSTKYTADISALSLTEAPTKAYKDTSVSVATVTEANAGRCIAQDEVLTKVSSTLTNYTGTNTNSGMIEAGDSIQIDGSTDVVCSDVVETDNGDGTFEYNCTIPSQSTAPESAKVLDRSTTTTEASDVYDDATGKFTKTYNKIEKQGRAFKYKIEADKDVEVSKVTIPMNKEG